MELAAAMAEGVMQKMDSVMLLLEDLSVEKTVLDVLARLKYDMDSLLTVDAESSGSILPEIRRYLYAVDNLVDEMSVAAKALHKIQNQVVRLFHKNLYFVTFLSRMRVTMAIRATFHSSDAWMSDYDFVVDSRPDRIIKIREETCSLVFDADIIGRDEDKDEIINALLLSSDDDFADDKISVIPIVGMVGLGKTTLCQMVFNDQSVGAYFNLLLWVYIGDEFDLDRTIRKMVDAVTNMSASSVDLEQLQIRLRGAIVGKKLLLVLDDVWNTERDLWFMLRDLLSEAAPGSKVIITTHSEQVATTMGTVLPYRLGPLSDADAWRLFTRMAFERPQDKEDPELVEMGKEILKRTGYVPLAIRDVGSLLFGQVKSKWMELKSGNFSSLLENYYSVLSKLTYSQLPPHLKRCFAYCALFPRDYEIDKRQVIQLWIAQGFIQQHLPDERHQSLEDVGEECFMTLLKCHFFKDVSRDGQGNICSFKMHDLAFILAQYVTAGEAVALQANSSLTTLSDNGLYHLFFDDSSNLLLQSSISSLSAHLYSFVKGAGSTSPLTKSFCAKVFSHLRHLRVLDLHTSHLTVVPSSIGSLKHLKYLNLSENPFRSLPNSITKLVNLQVLDLSFCEQLRDLPRNLRRLVSLRHLYLDGCEELSGMPVGMGQMASLQTLSHFMLGKGNCCKLDELDNLNLKAELTIVFASQQHK